MAVPESRRWEGHLREVAIVRKEREMWRGCSCVSACYLLHRALATKSSGGQHPSSCSLSGNVLSQGFEGRGGRAPFTICPQGSVGQQHPRGNQCHERGLEEKLMDSGHM